MDGHRPTTSLDPESARLIDTDRGVTDWRKWGPYLAERAWGTVREDYSADGDAWRSFPHEQARSRAYRWNEDGLAGWSDDHQRLCFALALWNGRDPILKERIFGLTGPEGNHGEDPKEYWWFLDGTPTHSWMRWRYHYPQAAFPYGRLLEESRRRGRLDPEPELLDTGVFDDDRYWQIEVTYAKSDDESVCVLVTARNAGPEPATLRLLPTLWFRNTWSWGLDDRRPQLWWDGDGIVADHHELGPYRLVGGGNPTPLFCENDTNLALLYGVEGRTPYPKDGINDHVVYGADTVDPDRSGTKAALWYVLDVAPGATAETRLHLGPHTGVGSAPAVLLGDAFDRTMGDRRAEADRFYDGVVPAAATDDERRVARQAFAGLLWSKQWYHFDVDRWLVGDPAGPAPPPNRSGIRNGNWRHLNNDDVILMPDTWEYPWYAAWDLAFHCVAIAHIDPTFAKRQLILLCREWYQHPNGQLPAYEWQLGDVNPPVHAWAAMRVFEIDGARDTSFLERIFHKLLLNFTWWVNRKDAEGNNIFEGGFLGLDNIGPFDRSTGLPAGSVLEQSDGTAWMAKYCLDLLEMSLALAARDHVYEDVATKFFEHFAYIASAMDELWDEADGFYYDQLRISDGGLIPMRVRSMVGLLPITAVAILQEDVRRDLPDFTARAAWFLRHRPQLTSSVDHTRLPGRKERLLMSVVSPDRLTRVLEKALDEQRFLSLHGLRSLSRYHDEQPFELHLGGLTARLDYEPGESETGLFGGNSNWRGPVWFPLNFLVIEALRRYHTYVGPGFTVECPVGSGQQLSLDAVADELAARLVSLFLLDEAGRRPCFGAVERFATDPDWRDHLLFHEYFHGETGAGLGAPHQTGWTALVADLIVQRARSREARPDEEADRG